MADTAQIESESRPTACSPAHDPTPGRTAAKTFGAGAVGGVLVLIAVFGVPNAIEAHKNGNETGAIGALKSIGSAQALFREADLERDGDLDYATLAELGSAGLIDSVLASGTKDGYVFETSYGALNSEFLWFATARPIKPGWSGDRYFGTNHEGVIFFTSLAPLELNTDDCKKPGGAYGHC